MSTNYWVSINKYNNSVGYIITCYLAAAWHDGIDITTDRGLRRVVEMAGLDWADFDLDGRRFRVRVGSTLNDRAPVKE